MADHEVILTCDDGYETRKFVCNAPAESMCHAEFSCDCEGYYDLGMRNDVPAHRPDYDDPDTWHAGDLNPKACNLRNWFEGDSDEAISYRVVLPVVATWEGGFYAFEAIAPEPGGSES